MATLIASPKASAWVRSEIELTSYVLEMVKWQL